MLTRLTAGVADSALTPERAEPRAGLLAVGLPTLRLIRYAVGPFTLEGLRPGRTRRISNRQAWSML